MGPAKCESTWPKSADVAPRNRLVAVWGTPVVPPRSRNGAKRSVRILPLITGRVRDARRIVAFRNGRRAKRRELWFHLRVGAAIGRSCRAYQQTGEIDPRELDRQPWRDDRVVDPHVVLWAMSAKSAVRELAGAQSCRVNSTLGFREHIALSDSAGDAGNLDRAELHLLAPKHARLTYCTDAGLLSVDNLGLATREGAIKIDSDLACTTLKFGRHDQGMPRELRATDFHSGRWPLAGTVLETCGRKVVSLSETAPPVSPCDGYTTEDAPFRAYINAHLKP
jgi:hypothetical protein